jgi:hypothetical protein
VWVFICLELGVIRSTVLRKAERREGLDQTWYTLTALVTSFWIFHWPKTMHCTVQTSNGERAQVDSGHWCVWQKAWWWKLDARQRGGEKNVFILCLIQVWYLHKDTVIEWDGWFIGELYVTSPLCSK